MRTLSLDTLTLDEEDTARLNSNIMYDQSDDRNNRNLQKNTVDVLYQNNRKEIIASLHQSKKVNYSIEPRPPAIAPETMRSKGLQSPVRSFHKMLMRTYHFSQVPLSISSSGVFHSNQDDDMLETRKQSRVSSVMKRRGKYNLEHRTLANQHAQSLLSALGPNRSQVSNDVPLLFSKNHVLRFGYLLKQGSWRRNWKSVSRTCTCYAF